MKITSIEQHGDGNTMLALNAAGMTYTEIGRRFGISRNAVAGRIRDYKIDNVKAKPFEVVKLGTPLQLRGDFLVIGDVHVPTTDYEFAGLIPRVAQKHGIKQLIIAGDLFNMDSFSIYDSVVDQPNWHQERDAARALFKDWLECFDKVYTIMGNHDRRLQKWAGGAFDETDIYGMVTTSPKLTTSNFGYLTVETPAPYPWRITHGRNYSVNQLTVGSELANKYQCNIISHHQHHLSIGYDRYKRFVTVDNGGLFDSSQMAYVKLDDNKMPNMANGFTMLKNGVATLFGKYPFTDWAEYF